MEKAGCNCSTLISLTRQTNFNKLNDLLVAVVADIASAEHVYIHGRHDDDSSLSQEHDIIPISRGHDESAKLVIVGRKDPLDVHLLKDVLEVYANQYHHLTRGSSDLLTGLYNRRVFDEHMDRLFGSKRSGRQTNVSRAFAIMDVDYFKKINDGFGHLYGDEILILLSNMMRDSFRPDDWLFRYGGEEFIVVLNNIDPKIAKASLERFRQKVEERKFPQVGHVTVSIGVTDVNYDFGRTLVLTQADRALYFAKNNGRNRVDYYPELISDGKLEPGEEFGGDLEML